MSEAAVCHLTSYSTRTLAVADGEPLDLQAKRLDRRAADALDVFQQMIGGGKAAASLRQGSTSRGIG